MNIKYNTVIDLSHSLGPGIPCWPGDPRVELDTVATVAVDGFYLQRLSLSEHGGTHIGVAAHFHRGGTTVGELPPGNLIRSAVTIDVSAAVESSSDYRLHVADVVAWEREHGVVPEGAVVLLYTGWDRHWRDAAAYLGACLTTPGAALTPGFSLDAARFLANERGVAGLGIDTHGIDAGSDALFSVNEFWLRGERFHLENLTNLGLLPPSGITLFIGALGIAGGSGAPARVLALI